MNELGSTKTREGRMATERVVILGVIKDGLVVPQGPNDEAAEQLLARIRAQRQTQPTANGKPRTVRRGRTRKGESALPLFTRNDGASEAGEP
jgi:hypothetical protein